MRSMHRHIFHSGMSVLAAVACSLPVWAEGSEAIHDVDNPARQPYRNAVSFYVTDGNFFGGAFFPPVPRAGGSWLKRSVLSRARCQADRPGSWISI